ncbi:hypothetical protein JHK87_050096 [Glycine soja]|nr:hypothetical protein JHK87_050096 [Glycine soja]
MGFLLAANGLLVLYIAINLFKIYYGDDWGGLFEAITSYGLGGSSMALFGSVVDGGIYTKVADVGVDLVRKVERNIPEDDPRNLAVYSSALGLVRSMPGPREHVLQCFIRRNGVSKAYYMFLCLSSALVADDGKFITITLSQHFKHLQSASAASLPRLLANDAYLNRYSSENSNILKLETIFGQEMDREKANEWPQK